MVQPKDVPLFLYLPFQNVHSPLQAKVEDTATEPCGSIANAGRKTFCGMAMAADRAIGKLIAELEQHFPKDDVVAVISGDNGGMVWSGGNNCPKYKGGLCLRGQKATLYEGGVRNNALLCSKTMVPDAMKGNSYSKG